MNDAYALEQLRLEIKQIIESHYESLRRTRGDEQSGRIRNPETLDTMQKFNKYAILIYEDALKEVDLYLERFNKI